MASTSDFTHLLSYGLSANFFDSRDSDFALCIRSTTGRFLGCLGVPTFRWLRLGLAEGAEGAEGAEDAEDAEDAIRLRDDIRAVCLL